MSEIFNENLFSERFLIPTARLKHWDYGNIGYYFITICTRYKYPFFGDIKNNNVILSDIGRIAKKCWQEISQHFNNVQLDEYIIMPDHVHGIVRIKYKYNHHIVETRHVPVETCHGMSLQNNKNQKQYNKFSKPISGSIPMIINHYKGACTREINKIPHQIRFFHWQPRYYDRIIRNEKELNKIREYIRNNPKNI